MKRILLFPLFLGIFSCMDIEPSLEPSLEPSPELSNELVIQVIDPCFPDHHHPSRLPLEIFAEKVDSCEQVAYDITAYQTDTAGWLTLPKGKYNHYYVEDDWGPVVACDLDRIADSIQINLICPHPGQ